MELKYSPYRRFAASGREQSERGFTLIEVLIVVSIIAILATMTFAGVQIAQRQARNAQAKSEVANFCQSIDMYYTDEKTYPGRAQKQIDSDTNQFPVLYNRLLGDPQPRGPGGRHSPYLLLTNDRVVVEDAGWDEDADEAQDRWTPASRGERANPKVKKYYLDPWGNPYIYRWNKGRGSGSYDFYSLGPDGEDQTVLGGDPSGLNDDITNR